MKQLFTSIAKSKSMRPEVLEAISELVHDGLAASR